MREFYNHGTLITEDSVSSIRVVTTAMIRLIVIIKTVNMLCDYLISGTVTSPLFSLLH